MSGFTLCSLGAKIENATLPVVGIALTGLTLEALTTSAPLIGRLRSHRCTTKLCLSPA